MLALGSVFILFFLFYLLPGAVLISNSPGGKEKRLDNFLLSILLSLVFAPLTFTLLSRAVPGDDRLLLAAYVLFWALALVGVRVFRPTVSRWLPDFSALPKADKAAWLFSFLLTAIVVSLRFSIFQGYASQIGDDHYQLTKLTSIAATGLPSLYARQPLYPFTYYDLDFIAPALWVRYTGGAIGVAQAWVVHIGIQTFVVSLFFTRLIYMYATTRMTRLFGLIALHTATGWDVFFLPWLQRWRQELGWGLPHLDNWPLSVNWFEGFISESINWYDGYLQISMPITLYAWVPQHLLGTAVVGLIFYISITTPHRGIPQAAAVALLLVALFRTSTFVFIGAVPGLALWHFYELLTGKERIRQLSHLATTALVALAFAFPYLSDVLSKGSYLEFGLRSFVFLDIPGLPWLKYPITGFAFLLIEIGILLPLLLWLLMRPRLFTRPLRFWLCTTVGLLIPFIVRTPLYNDIAMRGVMPAQLAAAMVGCFVLTQWDLRKRRYVAALVTIQLILSVVTVGTELYYRFTFQQEPVPDTSRWIARNTPLNALVFYEHDRDNSIEVAYGQRLSFVHIPRPDDQLYVPVPSNAWVCLPDFNLHDANSLCAIEAHIPGTQPVYIRYLATSPSLDAATFAPLFESENGSIFSLSCPHLDTPENTNPPPWLLGPYHQLRALLAEIPADHAIAASTGELGSWLQSESYGQRLFVIAPEEEGAPLDEHLHLNNLKLPIDASSSPVWVLLDYLYIENWNDLLYTHFQRNYYVAQTPWLACKQRVVLALPSAAVVLHVVHSGIRFEGALEVSEWRTSGRPHRAGEIVPIELAWRKLEDVQLKFFVHLLDEQGVRHAQIDLPAAEDGSEYLQLTRMGLYLPPELPAGAYQIRLGVYRPKDGQRLMLPNGDDTAHIPLTVTP